MSLVVADTTPVSCMVRIGRVDLLAALFPDVLIPIAVAEELARGGRSHRAGCFSSRRSRLPQ